MENLLKQWKNRLDAYKCAVNLSRLDKDISFNKGKVAGLEFAIEEFQNFISVNNCVSGRSELLIDFIKWFRQHPEYEQVTETPLAELYDKSINSH